MLETSMHEARVSVAQHELWVDNLRVLVIAGVIVVHTATGYVLDIAGWYYDDERSTSGVWSALLAPPGRLRRAVRAGTTLPDRGLVLRSVPRSEGTRRVRTLQAPPTRRAAGPVRRRRQSTHRLPGRPHGRIAQLHLLPAHHRVIRHVVRRRAVVFSLVYAAWEELRPTAISPQPLRPGVLVVAILTIAVSSFVVWLVWPLDGEMFLNLRVPQWPQGAVLFALGVHRGRNQLARRSAARAGPAARVDDRRWDGRAPDAARHRIRVGGRAVNQGRLADPALRALRRRDRRGLDACGSSP